MSAVGDMTTVGGSTDGMAPAAFPAYDHFTYLLLSAQDAAEHGDEASALANTAHALLVLRNNRDAWPTDDKRIGRLVHSLIGLGMTGGA